MQALDDFLQLTKTIKMSSNGLFSFTFRHFDEISKNTVY